MVNLEICPICKSLKISSMNVSLSDAIGMRKILSCSKCNHMWDLDAHVNYNEYYNDLYKLISPPKFAFSFWKSACFLKKYFGNKKIKLIDIGSNNGRFLSHLPSCWELYGVESCSNASRIAKEYMDVTIMETPIELATIDTYGPFDAITLWAVIEHLHDPSLIIRKLSNSLRKGGILCIMTGDNTSILAKTKRSKWIMYGHAGHFHFFSEKSLDYLLKDNGLKVVRKYWTTGYVCNYKLQIFNMLKKIFNVAYDISPLTKTKLFDHMYIYALKE